MDMEDAINFCLAKGYKEESRDEHRVVMVKHRTVRLDKQIILTQADGQVYFTSAKTGAKRKWPEGWFARWLASPHF